jgi:hypothetical protein
MARDKHDISKFEDTRKGGYMQAAEFERNANGTRKHVRRFPSPSPLSFEVKLKEKEKERGKFPQKVQRKREV